MIIERDAIDRIFRALNDQIGIQGGFAIGLVVCGGTALTALGLIIRTTKDVDVLGLVKEDGAGIHIKKIENFPEWFCKAATIVQRDFDLPENWINLGPAPQVELGLPEGFESRLIKKKYGDYLSIYYISRIDQVYFKLYAAVDRNDYHTDDLFALEPTIEEIEKASEWVLTQDVSDDFRQILKDFLRKHNYEVIFERI